MNRHRRFRFFFAPFLLMALFGLSGIVYWLWNHVLVDVAAVRPVSFWQAVGLLVLSRILFGGFRFGQPSGRFGGPPWREKWRNMTDEEREKFKAEWRRRRSG